jgi:hypothetical protein
MIGLMLHINTILYPYAGFKLFLNMKCRAKGYASFGKGDSQASDWSVGNQTSNGIHLGLVRLILFQVD